MVLPRNLLALSSIALATLPVLALSASLLPTSSNDPFRAVIIVYRTQQPEPPLCCLKPLPTVDSPEGPEDILLSFDEWKSKQLHTSSSSVSSKANVKASDSDSPDARNADVPPIIDAQLPPDPIPDDNLPPHFRVPITDRFNYANLDCSARVHTSHRSAKSASSILSSKKDKYMLSPCSSDPQFVVVELCDDIRIDTVQLANFEFFSGVFKDFSVSVAKTYTGTNEGWIPAGTYRAKNVRGVQSFHPPTSLRDFYRYIRIDFHSHYGHEYYCPISLLRVYGLTHLEEWKWDTWQAESHARLKDSAAQGSLIKEYSAANNATGLNISNSSVNVSLAPRGVAKPVSNATSRPSPVEATNAPTHELSSSHNLPSTRTQSQRSATSPGEGASMSASGDGEQQTLGRQHSGVHSVTDAISSLLSIPSPASFSASQPTAEPLQFHSYDSETQPSATHSSQPSDSPTPPLVQQAPHTQSPFQGTGESIYRTIMNRLTILEANHTLYARYVEEQTAGVREVLRKLNEEVGRLESVGRMQAQMYQRTVHEWERQRLRLELEHGELLSRVNHLSEEVVLEKRLGIAQLCLLLAVLVFIGLTRGAPAQQFATMHRSTNEWGIRPLSFGNSIDSWNGWNQLTKRGRSPNKQSEDTKAEMTTTMTDGRPELPDLTSCADSKPELNALALNLDHAPRDFKLATAPTAASSHRRARATSTFRTPTKPRPPMLTDRHTLPRAEPITRSHSSSTTGHPHARSAKRWARTAHLHEIKVFRERRWSGSGKRSGAHKDRENVFVHEGSLEDDVFDASFSLSPSRAKARSRPQDIFRHPFTSLETLRHSEESTDADAWIDTDADDEEASVTSETAVILIPHEHGVFGRLRS